MKTTFGYTSERGSQDMPLEWALVLAHHPTHALVGQRLRLNSSTQIVLGRGAALLGPGGLDDERLSRTHAEFSQASDGTLRVEDLGSRNGTFVDGRRVQKRQLVEGNVIALGSLIWVARREPLDSHGEMTEDWVAVSSEIVAGLAALSRPRSLAGTTVLNGPPGSGKERIARRLHELSERSGAFVVVDCAGISATERHADLPGLLESAHHGTLYLDALADAGERVQKSLLRFLQTHEVASGENSQLIAIDASVVVGTSGPLTELVRNGGLRADLVAALGSGEVQVPPLEARVEDIPALATLFARRFAGRELSLHRKLASELMARPWPGNCRELEHLMERAVVEADELDPLRGSPGLIETPSPDAADVALRTEESFRIAKNGSWFEAPGGARVELDTRPTLMKVLERLVQHPAEAQRGLTISELFAAGWPGERPSEGSQSSRVYVALTTLRKLGLRDVLTRDKRGYRLSRDVAVRLVSGDDRQS